jgi:hypothetical protein
MSADGRFVTFHSNASNLVDGDTNSAVDVFVRDLLTRATTLVSVNTNRTGPGIKASSAPRIRQGGRVCQARAVAKTRHGRPAERIGGQSIGAAGMPGMLPGEVQGGGAGRGNGRLRGEQNARCEQERERKEQIAEGEHETGFHD